MNRAQRLAGIRAKCVELLKIAGERTPGSWEVYYKDTAAVRAASGRKIAYCATALDSGEIKGKYASRRNGDESNTAFIASCAGNAESGWRSTVAAIDHISELLRHPVPELTAAAEALADVILNEWEGVV